MANRKRLFRDKPTQGDFGIYTFLGDPINEAIMDSNIQNFMTTEPNQFGQYYPTEVDDLKSMGETSIRINSLVIKNRGVRTRINDVYFHFYLFSSEFFNPIDDNGNWRGYETIKSGMHGGGSAGAPGGSAWFYAQNGPNYDENGEKF